MTSNASLLLSNRLKFRWPTVAGPPFLQTFRAELSWFYWALVSYVRIQILLHNVIPTLQGILCAYVTISGLWGRTHLNVFRSLHVQLRMLKFCPCYHDAKMSRASSCHFLNVHLQEWGIKDTRRSTAVQAHSGNKHCPLFGVLQCWVLFFCYCLYLHQQDDTSHAWEDIGGSIFCQPLSLSATGPVLLW